MHDMSLHELSGYFTSNAAPVFSVIHHCYGALCQSVLHQA